MPYELANALIRTPRAPRAVLTGRNAQLEKKA